MKPSKKNQCSIKTEVHWDWALHSLWWSPKKRSGSPIYLHRWANSRYFGKASVLDEKVCVLKKQVGVRGDDFLVEKGRDYSQVGREQWCVIDLWTIIFQFEKWSGMSSSFPVWKVVWDFWRTYIFQFGKWSRSNGHFCNENGSMDCWCTIDNDSPCGQCGGMV